MEFIDHWPKWLLFADDRADTVDDITRAIRQQELVGLRVVAAPGTIAAHLVMSHLGGNIYLPMRNGGAVGYDPARPGQYYIARGEAHIRYPLAALGFSSDYEPTYNVRMNAVGVLKAYSFQRTAEDRQDLVWLCNLIGRLHRKYGEVYGLRLCRADENHCYTQEYAEQMPLGCSGTYDHPHTNTYTNRTYWVGFNYVI